MTTISILADVPARIGAGWRLDRIMSARARLPYALVHDGTIVALGGRRVCLRAERSRARHNPALAGGVVVAMTPDTVRAAVIATAEQRLCAASRAEAYTTRLDDDRARIWPDSTRTRTVNGGLDSRGARAARAALEDRVERMP